MDLWALSDLATPWCLHVVVTLRIAEHIAAGKDEINGLAAAAGADPDALRRVLHQLIPKGVFEEPAPGHFALNDNARQLLDPQLRVGFDLDGLGGRMAHSWSSLLSAVRTGKTAYPDVFGCSFWEDLDTHPQIASEFDTLMGPGHGIPDSHVLLDPADWSSVKTVVDVGGGTGTLLAELLRAHSELLGTLVDLPRPVAGSAELFDAAGVSNRVTTSAQSFFDPLPAGADLYLLKKVLSDWPDPEAKAILTRCAEAARPSGRVVVLSGVTPEDRSSPELLMLVLVGGRDRTLAEFRELAREAGLTVHSVGYQPSGRFIVECRLI